MSSVWRERPSRRSDEPLLNDLGPTSVSEADPSSFSKASSGLVAYEPSRPSERSAFIRGSSAKIRALTCGAGPTTNPYARCTEGSPSGSCDRRPSRSSADRTPDRRTPPRQRLAPENRAPPTGEHPDRGSSCLWWAGGHRLPHSTNELHRRPTEPSDGPLFRSSPATPSSAAGDANASRMPPASRARESAARRPAPPQRAPPRPRSSGKRGP